MTNKKNVGQFHFFDNSFLNHKKPSEKNILPEWEQTGTP